MIRPVSHPRRLRDRRPLHQPGQSIVEFAFVVPLLLLLVFGLIDTSMLLATNNMVSYACRQAARLVEQGNPDSTTLSATIDALKAGGANPANLLKLTIYRANSVDTAANTQSGDNPNMDYVYTFSGGTIVSQTGAYTDTMRASADNFGVTLQYRYTGITPFFSGGFTFSDVTNTQIDPSGNIYSIATPIPPPTFPPAPTQAPPTPRPTYTPLPTYTQPPTTPTATVPAPTLTAMAQTAATQTAVAATATMIALSATPTT